MVSVAGGSGSRSYTSRWKAMLHMSTRMGSTRVSVAWSPRKGSSPAPLKDSSARPARSSSDHSAGAHRPTTVSYASLSSSRMPPRSTESSPMKDAPAIATGRWASGSRPPGVGRVPPQSARPAGELLYAGSGFGEPFLRQAPVPYGADQGVGEPGRGPFVRVRVPAADADRVGPRGDGPDGGAGHAVAVGHGAHLDGVGHDQTGEAEFAAQQVLGDGAAQGRRPAVVVGRDQQVAGHGGPHARVHRGDERRQRGQGHGPGPRRHLRQPETAADNGVAVAREVLGAGGDPRRLQAPYPRGGVPGDHVGACAEGVDPDHRVVRIGVDVGARRVAQGDAERVQVPPDAVGDPLGDIDVVEGAQRAVSRPERLGAGAGAGGVARLLVEGDDEVEDLGVQRGGERCHLLGAVDVAAEQDDGGEPFGDPAAHPVRHGGAGEARLEHGVRQPQQAWVTADATVVGHAEPPGGVVRVTEREGGGGSRRGMAPDATGSGSMARTDRCVGYWPGPMRRVKST
ncbi:hypothetical protein SHIRM173S_07142 [Streptomyces hirsutus]